MKEQGSEKHELASFFMTRCEYLPVRSVAASLRQTVMKTTSRSLDTL
jgi:hypothetical protein